MTDFILTRVQLDPDVSIGDLKIGGHHIAFTCEDAEREVKIPHQTCIPRGRYRIKRLPSARWGHPVLHILDVPNFTDIEIHPGNKPEDTDGCVLPGLRRLDKGVADSRLAVTEVEKWFDAIERQGEEAWIVVQGPEAMLEAA